VAAATVAILKFKTGAAITAAAWRATGQRAITERDVQGDVVVVAVLDGGTGPEVEEGVDPVDGEADRPECDEPQLATVAASRVATKIWPTRVGRIDRTVASDLGDACAARQMLLSPMCRQLGPLRPTRWKTRLIWR
jgi:hypothetical protein